MTYSSGSQILAADYNTFTTTAGGLNDIWSTGSGDKGWGQTAFVAQTTGNTVAATQWATLVNNLATSGSQTNTTITSRTAPVTGNIVGILANVQTDINNCTTNRNNAVAVGTEYGTWTGTVSKTTGTGGGTTSWSFTWNQTITFPSAAQTRYFFNAGGRIRLQMSKTSTGTDIDPDWNAFVAKVGSIYITGAAASKTIAGTAYTGTTRIGGTGGTQTTLATSTGYYALTSTPVTIFLLANDTSPYTGETITVTAAAGSATDLTLAITWSQPAVSGAGQTNNIDGGTATNSPSTTITGTAPTVLCTYIPPSTTSLTNTWGTPTIGAAAA